MFLLAVCVVGKILQVSTCVKLLKYVEIAAAVEVFEVAQLKLFGC
jgi:hypothetical protein